MIGRSLKSTRISYRHVRGPVGATFLPVDKLHPIDFLLIHTIFTGHMEIHHRQNIARALTELEKVDVS